MPKRTSTVPIEGDLFATPPAAAPNFDALLAKPLVKPLPDDFSASEEAEHLKSLWLTYPKLRAYTFEQFVSAGGSGLVFRAAASPGTPRALKIARRKLFIVDRTDVATNLSPVSETELRTLERLSHPNLVRLYDVVDDPKRGIVGLATTYVDRPQNIDQYLRDVLAEDPDPKKTHEIKPFSLRRLNDACAFVAARCLEIAGAMQHLHRQGIYHFDIKPANILVSGTSRTATLTDMGSCVHEETVRSGHQPRVHFTWTYAHPDLQSLIKQPAGISGGGLKASAQVDPNESLSRYDLYALGKTLQELLAILDNEFEEICSASYGFRFLHLLACLLLDGRNSPVEHRTYVKDGRRFVDDVSLGYSREVFIVNQLRSIDIVVDRLQRFSHSFSWVTDVRELDPWQPDLVNTSRRISAPFTKRVAAVVNHPAMARLKRQLQLGWMSEVFPGATHTRWAHSIGVMSHLASMYGAIASDPEIPTFRVLAETDDVDHALLASLLHDIGQSTFGHDFEIACPNLFRHEHFVERLINDPRFDPNGPLAKTIGRWWPRIKLSRLLGILGLSGHAKSALPVDGLAKDLISGPIDADKLDYVQRDSTYCGVSYGDGVDVWRLLRALSVSPKRDGTLSLAYKAKGRASVEALLVARYQMYNAVYWHHTYRDIQGMFAHGALQTFSGFEKKGGKLRGVYFSQSDIRNLFYHRVIAGRPWTTVKQSGYGATLPDEVAKATPPRTVQAEPALDFVWRLSADPIRELIERLSRRDLYKRVFELRLGQVEDLEYSAMVSAFSGKTRIVNAEKLQTLFMDSVDTRMRQRWAPGDTTTNAESAAQSRMKELRSGSVPLIVLDFPVRGIADEKNVPREIGDTGRKYFTLPSHGEPPDNNVFRVIRRLQVNMSVLRVFAAPELHEMIIRYLNPNDVRDVIAEVLPSLKKVAS